MGITLLIRHFFNGSNEKNTKLLKFETRCGYDSAGNVVDNDWYSPDKVKYNYDSEGNPIKETHYKLDGNSWAYEIENEYDTKNNLVKATYNSDGSISYWREYEYDTKNNLVKDIRYDSDGSSSTWTEYEYDAKKAI